MRVLVVDDDDISREIVRAILEELGHEVSSAHDGQAAWEMLLVEGADVIISDWKMPHLDGLELCQRVRAHPRLAYPYFILLSAYSENRDILAAMRAGVDDHLVKPPAIDDLRGKLIAAARVSGLHAELADRRRGLERANSELLESRGALQLANADLERLAHRDALTGLGNRLAMGEETPSIQARFERYGHGFCLAMLDVDEFKLYNDTFGHQAGDRLLGEVGAAIASEIRACDLAYRYGGEEFLIVYPNQTIATTTIAVDRIRQRVENIAFGGDGGRLTISAGIAMAASNDSFEGIVRRADVALYRAKQDGRNHVRVESREPLKDPE